MKTLQEKLQKIAKDLKASAKRTESDFEAMTDLENAAAIERIISQLPASENEAKHVVRSFGYEA